MEERANFSRYLVLPTKYSFPKVVRILGYVMAFVSKARKNKPMNGDLLRDGRCRFSAFHGEIKSCEETELAEVVGMLAVETLPSDEVRDLATSMARGLSGADKQKYLQVHSAMASEVQTLEVTTDKYIHLALVYLYRKATCEVKQFCKKETWERLSVECDGVLLSKG